MLFFDLMGTPRYIMNGELHLQRRLKPSRLADEQLGEAEKVESFRHRNIQHDAIRSTSLAKKFQRLR